MLKLKLKHITAAPHDTKIKYLSWYLRRWLVDVINLTRDF